MYSLFINLQCNISSWGTERISYFVDVNSSLISHFRQPTVLCIDHVDMFTLTMLHIFFVAARNVHYIYMSVQPNILPMYNNIIIRYIHKYMVKHGQRSSRFFSLLVNAVSLQKRVLIERIWSILAWPLFVRSRHLHTLRKKKKRQAFSRNRSWCRRPTFHAPSLHPPAPHRRACHGRPRGNCFGRYIAL